MENLSGTHFYRHKTHKLAKPLFSSRLEEARVDLTSQTSL